MRTTKAPRAPVPEASREAKRLAAVVLDVLAGSRTPADAAQALGVSLPRYYQLEGRGMRGLVSACEPVPRGPRPDPGVELAAVRKENERLARELGRQQALVRLTQRTVGVAPPAAKAADGKKTRKRSARALRRAERLRQEADAGCEVEPVADAE